MARGNRKVPGINSSSTADIAFIILIFFLVTTSMDTDKGLTRRLPEPPKDETSKPPLVKERNILIVKLNKDNRLMVANEEIQVSDLKERAKTFITNPYNDPKLPEKTMKNVEYFGSVLVSENHVISLQNDRGTSYQAYINVQNELSAAYNEVRNELAREKWGKGYAELSKEEKKAIDEIYPSRISEAEPKNYGGRR